MILEEMEKAESLQAAVKREEADFKAVETDAKKASAELDAAAARLEAEAGRLRGERDAVAASVPQDARELLRARSPSRAAAASPRRATACARPAT